MGKYNEIQQQTTQSYGSNSFTTTIKENTVEFDSAKDKFTFKDPVEVPSINVNGQESVAFTSEDRVKLDNLQTPMQIKGRVDSVADLENIENPSVGDTYLVGLSGSETFEEYVCIGFSGSPEQAEWENVGTTQKQSDWNQNDNTKADYIKNRTHYVETTMSTVFNDTVSVTTMSQDNIYFYQGQTELTEEFEIEEGQTYKVTKDGVEYEIVATEFQYSNALIYGNLEELESGSFAITIQRQLGFGNGKGGTVELVVMGISSNEVSNVSLKIEAETESVHTLADKYLSDNIARTSDIPSQVFGYDSTNYLITTDILPSQAGNTFNGNSSLFISRPNVGNNTFNGSYNLILNSGNSHTYSGSNNIIVTGGASASSNYSGANNTIISNASAMTVSGNGNVVITGNGASGSTMAGNDCFLFCGYGGNVINNTETASVIIGGTGGVKFQNGGYNKFAANAFYGSEINANHSAIFNAKAIVSGTNSVVIGGEDSSANTISGGSANAIINNNIGTITGGSHNMNINNTYGGTISAGANNIIMNGCGPLATITEGQGNTIYGNMQTATISGGSRNMIVNNVTSITIPSTVSGVIILGKATAISSFESNTVYVDNLDNSGIITLGTIQMKDDSGVLKVSTDAGTTWQTVTLS